MNWQDEQKKVSTGVTGGQEPVALSEGFSLVAVKGFDELMYWLDRCEVKGHLENCPDLIEPYEAFDYRIVDNCPQPKREWVGLTDEEKSELWEVSRAALPRYATYASLIEAKLKQKNGYAKEKNT